MTDRIKVVKILGWAIAVLALNNFITCMTSLYFAARVGYMPSFIMTNYLISSYSLYLYPQHGLYEILDKSKAIFLDSFLQRVFLWRLPFIYNPLFFISAIGIIRFKNWARRLMVVCLIFLLLLMCISFSFKFNQLSIFWKIIYLFKTLILLYPLIYLTRPKVREQFK